jgi:hypothetical protein
MSDLMNKLYGPLPVKYCLYYYILSIITFLSFLVALGNLLLNLIRRKIDGTVILQLNLIIITFVGYFTNRLLYSMCAGSLK